jgi:DNA transformation protein
MKPEELGSLPNIGPTVGARLERIGIRTRADLAALGAPEVYRRLVCQNGGLPLPVCYYLYSIQGALDGVHWNAIGDVHKQKLLRAVGRAPKRRHLR